MIKKRGGGGGPGSTADYNNYERSRRLERFAASLQDSPGKWDKYPLPLTYSSAHAAASRINHRKSRAVKAFKDGQFEATVRFGILYVRAIS